MKRLKVLVSAYACEPKKGSEPGVGWNWIKQIAHFHELWVLTRANNRETIERAVEQELMPNVHWVYFDLPRWARFWKRGQRAVHLYYYLWQIGAYFVGKRLHKEVGFDLVHHATLGVYWMPSFLVLLPIPFVWGPVGGGESAPRAFRRSFSWRARLYEDSRDLVRWVMERDPFVQVTASRARVALVKTSETGLRLKRLGVQRVETVSEVAFPTAEIEALSKMPLRSSNPFRFVSVGRLLHWKGFHLGLEAFARFLRHVPQSEYWLIGDGSGRRNLERLAERLGVGDKVNFWGSLPRRAVLEKLAECDVLVHPSLHDSGGWVCLEAMAVGRAVICLDLGGPALQVTDETGFKVKGSSPEQVVSDLSHAMRMLVADRELLVSMGRAGQERVKEHFNWDKKGERIRDLYNEVLCRPRTEEIKSRCTLE